MMDAMKLCFKLFNPVMKKAKHTAVTIDWPEQQEEQEALTLLHELTPVVQKDFRDIMVHLFPGMQYRGGFSRAWVIKPDDTRLEVAFEPIIVMDIVPKGIKQMFDAGKDTGLEPIHISLINNLILNVKRKGNDAYGEILFYSPRIVYEMDIKMPRGKVTEYENHVPICPFSQGWMHMSYWYHPNLKFFVPATASMTDVSES